MFHFWRKCPEVITPLPDLLHPTPVHFYFKTLLSVQQQRTRGNHLELSLQQRLKSISIWLQTVFMMKPAAAAAAKSLQSCPTLCDPMDGSPLGSPVPGILQARILEWVAISFSNASKWKVKVKSLSHVRVFDTPWTAAYQALLSMGFSRQEYWSGLPLPSPLCCLYL